MKHNKLNKLCLAIAATGLVAGYTAAASAFTITGGDNTKVDMYGYIKADLHYDLGEQLGTGPAASIGKVLTTPASSADETNGHLNFTAAQTRLGFNFTQGTDEGNVNAKLEGDFAPGYFRIRHAYVEWQGFLVGQTWTNFTSWNDWANTLDWDGPSGHAGGSRHGQIRYTMGSSAGTVSVALEQPETGDLDGTGAKGQLPDLTARFEGKAGMINYAVGAMGRQYKTDNPGGSSDTANGWGAMANISIALDSGTTLRAGILHGDGLGFYMYPGTFKGAYVDSNGKIQTLKQTGANLSASQALTSNSDLSLSYGYTKSDKDPMATATTHKKEQNAYLTYTISPVKHLMYGVEFAHYWVTDETGATGNANRLQFTAQYSF